MNEVKVVVEFGEGMNGQKVTWPFCHSYRADLSASSADGIKPGLSEIAQAGQGAPRWHAQFFRKVFLR